ncbi:MCE family protein [Solicola gregarius]|uniref:MCE family protein n=1 Tax=Solicola gregarius TaxID=2908642 RepID=A0AA46TF50_9ACTN|nr:MCE family protein [Solicola gregarius]UYM03724.1 MCE family protein [Solicola gregarius]
MARTPVLERTSTVRTLGIAFIVLMLIVLWITWGIFNKSFRDTVEVSMLAPSSGLQLSEGGDVKMRGVLVGEVESIELASDGEGAQISLDLDPDKVDKIPADVAALIVPKTLFGQKYVDLQIPEGAVTTPIAQGDVISQAKVPAEVETLLNDLYPLLRAVKPADLSKTLNALATALDGRGEEIGENLENLNDYLGKLNTVSPELVDDIVKLGDVSETYADAMPDIGTLLRNAVETGDTIVEKQDQLAEVFSAVSDFSDVGRSFFSYNGTGLIRLNHQARPTMSLLAEYSPIAPCVTKGAAKILPRLNQALRGNTLHGRVMYPVKQPTPYTGSETPILPPMSDQSSLLAPNCLSAPDSPYGNGNPSPGAPFELLQKFGIDNDHNKYPSLGRPAPVVGGVR